MKQKRRSIGKRLLGKHHSIVFGSVLIRIRGKRFFGRKNKCGPGQPPGPHCRWTSGCSVTAPCSEAPLETAFPEERSFLGALSEP